MREPALLKTARADLRKVPATVASMFVVSVVVMNLLANKTIYQAGILALDGGFFISWAAFMSMDIVTKGFGQRTANTLSVFALLTNLIMCLIFYLVSVIPTETDYTAFNSIFGGTWFILLSSSIAFLTSAVLNNMINEAVGRCFRKKPDGMLAFVTRSYVSTFIGQFWDNLVFAVLTFRVFAPIYWDGFSWTWTQCLTCSLVGAVVELLMEVFFSPLGYAVLRKWQREGVIGGETKEIRK